MIKRIQFKLQFDFSVSEYLTFEYPNISEFRIISKSLDARGASRGRAPIYDFVVDLVFKPETFSTQKPNDVDLKCRKEFFKAISPQKIKDRPIIVGAGPAGLFAALYLQDHGVSSIILERGMPASERMKDIAKFWRYGVFKENSNVCFGEGGAGLFSDGKLITRVKSDMIQYVMNRLVDFGAPVEIAYFSNPHLGSNKIRSLISALTNELKEKGTIVEYQSQVSELIFENGVAIGVKVKTSHGEKIYKSDNIILATGHSAHDIYRHLLEAKVAMSAKDFAVGVRIEHSRRHIDQIQYGQFCQTGPDYLGAARYRLSYENKKTRRGTYSFCMCPGGYVLSSGTERDGIVVNGMSNYARNSHFSNSALVVSVKAEQDFKDILGGMNFQREIEKKAYEKSLRYDPEGRNLPASSVMDFLNNKTESAIRKNNSKLKNSSPSGIVTTSIDDIFPNFVVDHLKNALMEFEKNLPGYLNEEALLIAPETRTSAPVTIMRAKETLESISHKGLYPCGEGAGFAGGITSSAVDGVKVAQKILQKWGHFD